MKVSKEVKALRNRIEPLIDDHVSWLSIGLEYCIEENKWHITPMYEGGGDGHPSYLTNPCLDKPFAEVLQGVGDSLVSAIKDLKKTITQIEDSDLSLDRW